MVNKDYRYMCSENFTANQTFSLYAPPSICTLFRSTTPFRPFLECFDFFLRQQHWQRQMIQQRRIRAAAIMMTITAQNGTAHTKHATHTIHSINVVLMTHSIGHVSQNVNPLTPTVAIWVVGTAIKHREPVKQSFVIFDIQAL